MIDVRFFVSRALAYGLITTFSVAVLALRLHAGRISIQQGDFLETITAHAAVAYDHVLSEERAAKNERLAIENRVLRSLVGQP